MEIIVSFISLNFLSNIKYINVRFWNQSCKCISLLQMEWSKHLVIILNMNKTCSVLFGIDVILYPI